MDEKTERITAVVPEKLKKDTAIMAIQNNTDIRTIVIKALENYLYNTELDLTKTNNTENDNKIEIN